MIPAFYYSPPTSENYHGVGVVPDHTVPLSEEAKSYYIANIPEALDDQLQAAVAFVQAKETPSAPEAPSSPEAPPSNGSEGGGAFIAVFVVLLLVGGAMTVFFVLEARRKKRDKEHPTDTNE